MELNTIFSAVSAAGIIAILGWAWRINARFARMEAKGEGVDARLKRHSKKIEKNEFDVRAAQLTLAHQRGIRNGSEPGLRSHKEGGN